VLTDARPTSTPLRYTCITCNGTETNTTTGPVGETTGAHQYSPGFNGPVGFPVGVPLVCAAGLSMTPNAGEDNTSPATHIKTMSFIDNRQITLESGFRQAAAQLGRVNVKKTIHNESEVNECGEHFIEFFES
jgi:hypothetical protein